METTQNQKKKGNSIGIEHTFLSLFDKYIKRPNALQLRQRIIDSKVLFSPLAKDGVRSVEKSATLAAVFAFRETLRCFEQNEYELDFASKRITAENVAVATLLQVLNYAYAFEKGDDGKLHYSYAMPLGRGKGVYFAQSCIGITLEEAICLMWADQAFESKGVNAIIEDHPLLFITTLGWQVGLYKAEERLKKEFPELAESQAEEAKN